MDNKVNITTLWIAILMLFCVTLSAQNEIQSPYSNFGIGVPTNRTNGMLNSMGGVAYAIQSPYFVNFKNPASYAAFDSLSFVADASMSIYSTHLETDELRQKGSFARADYLAIGLPITRHWRTSVGILPFSDLGYDISTTRNIENIGEVRYDYSGTGGLVQFYWGNAFKICKGLSIGLNISYLFGNLNTLNYAYFSGQNFLNSRVANINYVDGIYLTGGVQYVTKIQEKHILGFGLVYENSAYVWTRENLLINTFTGSGFSASTAVDTVVCRFDDDAIRGTAKLPQTIGGGITYSYKDILKVGADVTWENWTRFSMNNTDSDMFKDAVISAVGLQYIPNPTSPKYMKRINFRAGVRYSTGYLNIRNQPIQEFSVACGIGFPIRTFNFNSSFNVMFEYIHTGTTKEQLIQQNYYRFSFSFTLYEKWYQRVKLD